MYTSSVRHVMLQSMLRDNYYNFCYFYVTSNLQGHSLGAHVAGNAGSATTSGKLSRVTGLDPALPGFHLLTSEKTRLDRTDATFVDIIHSCGGVLGFLQPLGQADFYPNAGTAVQPGCCCLPEIMGRFFFFFLILELWIITNKRYLRLF